MLSPSSRYTRPVHRGTTLLLASLFFVLPSTICQARDLHVGATEAGAYPSIQAAINVAQPGDTILLAPRDTPYAESAVFHNKNGEAEKPIVLDGQGATLDGSEPLKADEWTQIEPGLYRSTALPERLKLARSILGRYFFIFNDTVNRMGGASKGGGAKLKKPVELGPGEWTYIEEEKAFYIRVAPATELDAVRIPIRATGVSLNGDCSHIRIKNLTAQRVWNDGFNIHGKTRDVVFQNIRAIDCGDDGISAHEDCEITVDGMLSRNNATGFCHINQSRSDSRNIVIEDCISYGIYLLNDSNHIIRNCVVRSKSGYALRLTQNTNVVMKNVLLDGGSSPQSGVSIEAGATLHAAHIASWNLGWKVEAASVDLHDSAIAATKPLNLKAPTAWEADRNLWDVPQIQWHETVFPSTDFAAYVAAAGQEKNSRLEPLTHEDLLGGKTASGINVADLPKSP